MDIISKEVYEKSIIDKEKSLMPYKIYYYILTKWLEKKISGESIADKLLNDNFDNIVIYGMGKLGELLYRDLITSKKVKVKYTLDKNIDERKIKEFNTKKINNINIEDVVNVIIVTPMHAFDNIKSELKSIYNDEVKIISIDDLIRGE